jgi:dienelactone hydrolase
MTRHWTRSVSVALAAVTLLVGHASGGEPTRSGKVNFEPAAAEKQVPKRFQLASHTFEFEQKPLTTTSKSFDIWNVTFPSPVVTPHAANNTVHCEYFQPKAAGKRPAVVVLHILGGDFDLSRLFCRSFATGGTAALFVKLPYYGPRRQPGVQARMVSLDPKETVKGMTQAVLDIRRGAAWLAAQEEVDPAQLGVTGISLGGITGALAASAEPRFGKVCLLLAGGDIGQVAWESNELKGLRERWQAAGGTRESLSATLREVDPVTYAANVRGRKILMLNAANDEVIPKACTVSLWKAFGEPEIVWWDAGHYTAIRFLFDGLKKATDFFAADER